MRAWTAGAAGIYGLDAVQDPGKHRGMATSLRGGRGAWAVAVAGAEVLSGCTTVLGLDQDWHGAATGGTGGASSTSSGTGGAVAVPPSCAGLAPTCGPAGNESCCASSVVVGGTYLRSDESASTATVSDFRLDRFEITVGRFRAFVAGYPGNKPAAGAGAHPLIKESGWQAAWTAALPADQTALKPALKCNAMYQTWTDAPGDDENLPIACINWYEAFAFCAWDGGRLATEAEWNYAAAGGNEQRTYPWSNPPSATTIDGTYAVYNKASIAAVGSRSKAGDGKWEQADMAGGVREWTLDWFVSSYPTPCDDCAAVIQGAATSRVNRGGSFVTDGLPLLTRFRLSDDPAGTSYDVGARCARKP